MTSNHRSDESTVIDLAELTHRQQGRGAGGHPAPSHATGQVSSATGAAYVPVPHAPGRSRRQQQRSRRRGGARNGASTATTEKVPCPRHMPGHGPNKFVTRPLGQKRVLSLFYASDVALLDAILAYKQANPSSTADDAIDAFDEYQSADALANIVYETQAFDMVFKYPIPEHLRKVPQEPPVLDTATKVSDIEIDSQSSAAQRRRAERMEQERQVAELKRQETLAQQQQKEQLRQEKMDAHQMGWTHVDVPPETDGTKSDRQIEDERLEKERYRFKKALMKENLIIEEEPDIDGEEMYIKVYTPFWRLCVEAQRQRWKAPIAQPVDKNKKDGKSNTTHRFLPTFLANLIHRADNVSLPLRAESLPFKASQLRQYALAEKDRRWSDIVRHGGGVTAKGNGVGSKMGKDGHDGFFGTGQRGALTESIIMYAKIHTRRGDRLALQYAMKHKSLTDMFTLHDGSYKSKVKPHPNRRTYLYHSWVRTWRSQPLEEIRFYFGEKIALYFAWIEHYTRWLWSAAIVGTLFLIFGIIHYFAVVQNSNLTDAAAATYNSKQLLITIFDNPLTLPYTIFMSIWATLFFEFWKRKSNVLAYRWNMLDYERRERARPEFKPTGVRISPITGKQELYYPRYKQLVSLLMSVVVVLIAIGIVIVSVGSLMVFNVWLKNSQRKKAEQGEDALNSTAVTVITAVLNLVVIVLLGTVYAQVARVLTNAENHKRRTQYEDSLILKRFLFDFVNFYSALFYIAYFKETLGSTWLKEKGDDFADYCDGSCMGDLTIQLAIVFVGKQFINQVQEVAIPLAHRYWNQKEELAQKANLVGKYKEKANKVKPPQWTKDDKLPTYAPEMFEEYRELVIQFGFCTLFVTAFPIAPIFALLNNLIEIRVDAYKLLTQHRRPVSQSAQDIGSWGKILALITHVAVLTNAILIAFQSNWMRVHFFCAIPWVQTHDPLVCQAVPEGTSMALLVARVLFVFLYEHIIFLMKIGLSYLITDMPATVKLAVERESYYTRLALDEEEPALDEVLDDQEDDDSDGDTDDEYEALAGPMPGDEKHGGRLGQLGSEDPRVSNSDGRPKDDGLEDDLDGLEDDDDEDQDMSTLLARHGGCGCAAQGDGKLGTVLGGFEGTWLSKIRNKELTQQRQHEHHSLRHRTRPSLRQKENL